MIPIDLRSDTVTLPTEAMREAMARAPVGDDVYGEDPTVNEFQELMAAVFGKEAGLFVPTGTMSNQLAIKAHTQPGDELITEAGSHSFRYETAAPAFISHVQIMPIRGRYGAMDPADVEAALRPPEYYFPRSALICLENTHNSAGGCVLPQENVLAIARIAGDHGLALHLDGARIWNAHIASGLPLRELAEPADSVSVCFSKGLGAPVGSMLLGTRGFVTRAHKFRKILGGGMRQAGILAAAARYAFEHQLERLADDHARARRFAGALAGSALFSIDPGQVQTNMVMLRFTTSRRSAREAMQRLAEAGVLIGQSAADTLRAVFHLNVSDEQTDRAIACFRELDTG